MSEPEDREVPTQDPDPPSRDIEPAIRDSRTGWSPDDGEAGRLLDPLDHWKEVDP